VAHSLSAKKRIRQNAKKRVSNRARKSAVKTQIKKFEEVAKTATDLQTAEATLKETQKQIDQLVAKGTMHKNTAARKKGQLARKLNSLKTKQTS
jgi:small subunit ribosomal protein S20